MKISSIVAIFGLPALVLAEKGALRKNEGTQSVTSIAAVAARAVRILKKFGKKGGEKGGKKGKKKDGEKGKKKSGKKGDVRFKNDGTYLALGDSFAVGTQDPVFFTDSGYADQLFQYLEREYRFDNLEKLGCPGDDSGEVLGVSGGSFCYGDGTPLFPPGGAASQLDKAVEYLTANPGKVGLITLSIGGNDLLKCDLFGETDVAVLQKCIEDSLSELASNLSTIVLTLQATSPNVPIVAMNLYQPFVALWLNGAVGRAMVDLTMSATIALNAVLDNVYRAFQVPIVDAAETFGTFIYEDGGAGPDPPTNVRLVCQWTNMCEMQESGELVLLGDYDDTTLDVPRPDIHPNNEGYEVLADAHISLIKEMNLVAKAAPH